VVDSDTIDRGRGLRLPSPSLNKNKMLKQLTFVYKQFLDRGTYLHCISSSIRNGRVKMLPSTNEGRIIDPDHTGGCFPNIVVRRRMGPFVDCRIPVIVPKLLYQSIHRIRGLNFSKSDFRVVSHLQSQEAKSLENISANSIRPETERRTDLG
jgi:hypothetical protein